MACSESCSRFFMLLVAILAVGILWPSSDPPDVDIVSSRDGKRKHTRRSPVPQSTEHSPRDSTHTFAAVSAAPDAMPIPPSVDLSARQNKPREAPSALPSHSTPATSSNHPSARHMRVSWIGRNMNLHSRIEPIMLLLENVTGVRVTLTAPGGGAYLPEDTDVFLVQASDLIDVRVVHRQHKSHALFLFIATEPIFNTDNRLDVADVSFGQAPWQRSTGAACDDANKSPNFIRTPFALLRAMECSWGFPVTCGIRSSLRAGANVEIALWAARPSFALHIARHGGFPRELLLQEFRTLGKRLDRAGPLRNRTVDCPGDGLHCVPRMAWPSDLPQFTLQGKLALARRYRFAIQPENSRTKCQGYMTEKVVEGEFGVSHEVC